MPSITIRDGRFVLGSTPTVLRCGEMHYSRVPRAYWRNRLEFARAMGLNAVCMYLFWNYHETAPGTYDFTGEKDIAAFVDLARELGLHIVLRPGPYVCSEWNFGGMPARLLKHDNIALRSSDPRYLEPALHWIRAACKALSKHTFSRGGPIVACQVENEYGAFGNDTPYLKAIANTLRDNGIDVPLLRCDWTYPQFIFPGRVDDAVHMVANFGSDAQGNLTRLREAFPNGPLMSGEFWTGWFDWFGAPRNGIDPQSQSRQIDDIQWMLDKDASFSLYMFHGGTSFGHYAGANEQEDTYKTYVSGYDFGAPLTENGQPTAKYFKLREMFAAVGGAKLPDPPEPIAATTVPGFEMNEFAPLSGHAARIVESPNVLSMEQLDQADGCLVYRTDLTGRAASQMDLRVLDVHDYAIVFFNGRHVGTLDRRLKQNTLKLDVIAGKPALLEILVEAMGRINFGPQMADDRKGITRRVELGWLTLSHWHIEQHPLDASQVSKLRFTSKPVAQHQPCFYRGTFHTSHPRDTFLDLRSFSKGHVWVNGHHLGRYWSIGPQQTLYLPAPFQRAGENEVVVLDLLNEIAGSRTMAGLSEAIRDQLNNPSTS